MEECSSYIDITRNDMDILVNTTGIPCLRCVGGAMNETSSDTIFINQGTVIDSTVSGMRVDDNGVLMILDAARLIPDGNQIALLIDCVFPMNNPTFFHQQAKVYSNSMLL